MASSLPNDKPKPGDLIEVSRPGYQHWAVYVGDENVVHLTSNTGVSSSRQSVIGDKALIQKEKLSDVVGTNSWKINNVMDKKYDPRPTDDIVRDANAQVGNEFNYSVVSRNCEHFGNKLRYGKSESKQVRDTAIAAAATAVVAVGVGALAAMATNGPGGKHAERRTK